MQRVIRILIADRQPLWRAGVRAVLAACPDIAIAGEADAPEALRKLLDPTAPDVLVTDCQPQRIFGSKWLTEIVQRHPTLAVLIVAAEVSPALVRFALDQGVRGYLCKDCDPHDLPRAIRALAAGESFLCGEARRQLDRTDTAGRLSARERQILYYVGLGHTSEAIAEALCISLHTVNTHRRNMLRKLRLRSSQELIRFAVQYHQTAT